MFEIQSEPVSCRDAWWLVDQLRVVGRADEATAAASIENAITRDFPGVMLTDGQQAAVIAVLGNPPEGLVGLCAALLRGHRDRSSDQRP